MTLEGPHIRIELDSLPTDLFEEAYDWSGSLITRLINEPLFKEVRGRDLSSKYVYCQRIEQDLWRLELSKDFIWSNGKRITARDVCQHILRVRKTGAIGLLPVLMLKTLEEESDCSILLRTRFPLGDLRRVLANPILSPNSQNPRVSSGKWLVAEHSNQRILLEANGQCSTVELVSHDPKNEYDRFENGEVHISGPMTISPRLWGKQSQIGNARIFPLDILYALEVPSKFPAHFNKDLSINLDRNSICRKLNGMVQPCSRMSQLWDVGSQLVFDNGSNQHGPYNSEGTMHLLYTNFTGNVEMAHAICDELDINFNLRLKPKEQDYNKFLNHKDVDDSFRLVLVSSPWPHPSAMLTPFLYDDRWGKEFQSLCLKSLNEQDISTAANLANEAESILEDKGAPLIIIGRVNGCMRSHIGGFWVPPSGWIDFPLFS